MMNKVLVEGHRGWCAKYPENTLVSYKAALELGVDVLEFDVWLTTDKVPVLMHDKSALRTCGVDKNLCEMTLAEVKELEPCYSDKFGDEYKGQGIEVPTLEELLKLCKEIRPDIILGVEIKQYEEETVDYTVELLKKYGFFDTCCFYAFHAPIIKYIKTKYNGKTMAYPDFRMKEWTPDTYDYYDDPKSLPKKRQSREQYERYGSYVPYGREDRKSPKRRQPDYDPYAGYEDYSEQYVPRQQRSVTHQNPTRQNNGNVSGQSDRGGYRVRSVQSQQRHQQYYDDYR